ncbi:cutinase family protein [Actinokineospora iranica]|nr:cutinase family protein [Actinokineospora iranica]
MIPGRLRAIALAAVLAACFLLAPQAEATPSRCLPLHVYAVRGTGETGPLGTQISAIVDALRAQRPSGVSAQGNQYPAVLFDTGLFVIGKPWWYVLSVRDGVRRMHDDLAALRTDCPASDVVVIGYSQGADVVRRALATEPAPAHNRYRVLLLGDPNLNSAETTIRMVNDLEDLIDTLPSISLGFNHFFFDQHPEGPFTLGPVPPFPPGWPAESLCWRKDPACGGGEGGLPFEWRVNGAHEQYRTRAAEFATAFLTWSDTN